MEIAKDPQIKEDAAQKISPPFEGGVVGMIDSLIYTIYNFPTGVVDSLNS
jgi:hypothetical protein